MKVSVNCFDFNNLLRDNEKRCLKSNGVFVEKAEENDVYIKTTYDHTFSALILKILRNLASGMMNKICWIAKKYKGT